MRKIVVLILFIFIFFLAAFRPSSVLAKECAWSMDNGLKFCTQDFNTQQELYNTRVEFQCSYNCGGKLEEAFKNLFQGGQNVQRVDMDGTPVGPGNFSCVGVDFNQEEFVSKIQTAVRDRSTVCGAVGLGIDIGSFIIPGAGVGRLAIRVAGVGIGTAVSRACIDFLQNLMPVISARVVDKATNRVLCEQGLGMNVEASGEVTSQGGDIPKGVPLLEGINLFCKNQQSINTAIGCIPIGSTTDLINFILRWALGIAGGIAFLLILFAGFQIITSRGDPNRLKAGQELLTSAIAGLVLIIFSVFILRVIGFNILNISVFAPK